MKRTAGALRLACILFAFGAPAFAADDAGAGPSVNGFVKNFLVAAWPARPAGSDVVTRVWADSAAARLKLFWRPADAFSATAAYEISPNYSGADSALGLPFSAPDALAYRIADLNAWFSAPGGRFALTQNLDRLSVSTTGIWGELALGRQPISFGSARIVNPTDVLAPFTYQTLDKEERAGVDALRWRLPLGDLGELDAAWVAGREFLPERGAAYVKFKANVWATDATLLALRFREHFLYGLDLARTVGGATLWCEAAWVQVGRFRDRRADEDYGRLSLGADYGLADGLYGFIEFHHNGAGAPDPSEYPALAGRTAYREGAVYLLGRDYAAPGLSWQATPLLSLTGQALIQIQDGSLLLAPGFAWSLADDWTLAGGGFVGWGRRADGRLGDPDGVVPRSEFGLYPSLLYAALKWYY